MLAGFRGWLEWLKVPQATGAFLAVRLTAVYDLTPRCPKSVGEDVGEIYTSSRICI
jgi:hypothetical protein